MEMREVEAFLAVAEELHFGRAARRLHISPSRISQTVRVLERRVGAPLFERSSRRVRLTPLGRRLLADFAPAYQRLREGLREAQQAAHPTTATAVIRVGFASTLFSEVQPTLLAAFAAADPAPRLVASTHPPNDLYRWLERDEFEVDLFFLWSPGDPPLVPGRLRSGPVVRREPRGVIMPPNHPLARRSVVDVEELADHDVLFPSGHPQYADAWTPAATPGGRPIRRVHRDAHYLEDLPRVMADGDLVHVVIADLPRLFPIEGTVTLPLVGLPPVVCVPVWPPERDTPQVRGLAAVAARTGADLGWTKG
ncbi:LysR family transcriptional regulator [Allonocardiopsis opalescens]|nr:LysR family transcriptional regulator [Allonocardiopsis opalescens]